MVNLLPAGILLLLIVFVVHRLTRHTTMRFHRAIRGVILSLLSLVAALLLIVGGVSYWYTHRPLPSEVDEQIFQGITYIREVRSEPRPLVIHAILVDLNAPGIEFFVTPSQPTDGYQLPARKTSQFLDEFDVQVAVNASFFEPWWSKAPWNYYPHVGDGTNIFGLASSQGNSYGDDQERATLYLSRDNKVSFEKPSGEIYNAFPGNYLFLRAGRIQDDILTSSYHTDLHPRTAVALNETGDTLILVVVDGRQPNYSEGVSLRELAEIIEEFGGYTALNLDGGGSSTLVIEDDDGDPDILNSPIDNWIPGRERPIANHLGIRAHPP